MCVRQCIFGCQGRTEFLLLCHRVRHAIEDPLQTGLNYTEISIRQSDQKWNSIQTALAWTSKGIRDDALCKRDGEERLTAKGPLT